MYIKSYKTSRFAGIKDLELEFDSGLNIILGPNESGKSTIINGIYASLFKDINVKRNNNDDLEFLHKFMPKSQGDSIDSSLILRTQEGDYQVEKQWGEDKSVSLVTPDDTLIKNIDAVDQVLGEILAFGESTYSNIVFARQEDLKAVLGNILEDSSFKREIGDILRRALMELDGVSIEKIEENIEEELNAIYNRWDIEKSYPQNNRGVHNPYVNGLGLVVESYYKKENLKIEMERANRSEKEFEEISNRLSEVSGLREKYSIEKSRLEDLEGDINKRSILELEINTLEKELSQVMGIVRSWPLTEERLKGIDRELEELFGEKERLDQDRSTLVKLTRKKELEGKLERIKGLKSDIKRIEDELELIGPIAKEDIDDLEKIGMEIMTLKASLNAGELLARLNRKDVSLYISRDFAGEEDFELEKTFQARNSIKVGNEDFEFEIKLGERDFEKLHRELEAREGEKKDKLSALKIKSIEEGKMNVEKINSKTADIISLNKEVEMILAGEDLKSIEEEVESLAGIRIEKSEEDLNQELERIKEKEMSLLLNKNTSQSNLKDWTEKYGDFENIFNIVGDNKLSIRGKKTELEGLKSLPEEFNNEEEFKERLRFLRSNLEEIDRNMGSLNEKYYEVKNNLLDESYEELRVQSIEAEKYYERYLKRGEKLLMVRRAFNETKEKMLSNPMKPLVEEFRRLLGIITDGKYDMGHIGEDFDIELVRGGNRIPFDLLSAGTYDSVSLALRFALLEYLFEGRKGFLILDDSLVDLDPRRKGESIRLIKEFSKAYQIIFTTCNPETAEELGGNIINL